MAYIPKAHEKYGLLPDCRKRGGEVFDYPSKLILKIESIMGFSENIFPYGFSSYDEYFSSVDSEIESKKENSELVGLLEELKAKIKEMNVKEEWSVVRFVGNPSKEINGLTAGKIYYWPTCRSVASYRGVVNDEEFTSYLYPTDKNLWEILEDPTGMAHRTIFENGKGSMSAEEYDYYIEQLENLE